MNNLGIGEIVLIAILAFIFIGPDKMLTLARDLKKALARLTRMRDDVQRDLEKLDEPPSSEE